MLRSGTNEFARWRDYLFSIVPSHQNNEKTRSQVKPAQLQKPPTALNRANGDPDHDEQAFVHKVHCGLESMGPESQLWDD
jgi:hypothetical protein